MTLLCTDHIYLTANNVMTFVQPNILDDIVEGVICGQKSFAHNNMHAFNML